MSYSHTRSPYDDSFLFIKHCTTYQRTERFFVLVYVTFEIGLRLRLLGAPDLRCDTSNVPRILTVGPSARRDRVSD